MYKVQDYDHAEFTTRLRGLSLKSHVGNIIEGRFGPIKLDKVQPVIFNSLKFCCIPDEEEKKPSNFYLLCTGVSCINFPVPFFSVKI